jgi:DNA-binding LacI/PurR family transcriptional regulator
VGFDNLSLAERTDPPLTTIHQSIQDLGKETARMLVAVIAGQQPPSIVLPTRLVRRESA